MHATHHLHPRRAILTAVAALALALAVAAVLAPAARHDEPAWEANPFAYPLLQVPSR